MRPRERQRPFAVTATPPRTIGAVIRVAAIRVAAARVAALTMTRNVRRKTRSSKASDGVVPSDLIGAPEVVGSPPQAVPPEAPLAEGSPLGARCRTGGLNSCDFQSPGVSPAGPDGSPEGVAPSPPVEDEVAPSSPLPPLSAPSASAALALSPQQLSKNNANLVNDAVARLKGVGRSRKAAQQYAPRIKKYRKWCAEQNPPVEPTALQTAVNYAIFTLFKGSDGRTPVMGASAWCNLLCSLQWDLTYGLNLDGEACQGEPPKIRACGDIANATKCVAGHVGTRARDNESGCLNRMIPVASRETVLAGSMLLAVTAARRVKGSDDGTRRRKHHDMVSGRLLWLSQDDSLGRATEVASSSHLGGLTKMPKYPALGPHEPVNLVFTHNINKQNQDAAYDVHVHLFDKTDPWVAASSILALNDILWQLAELNDIDLLDEQHANGWQHINVFSSFQPPRGAGADARARATGKLMSQEKIREVYSLVLGDMERRTGLEAKKQLHFLRGAASKRKSIEHGDHLTTEKDMGYEPSRFAKHYNQEVVSVKTVAAGLYAEERVLAKGEYLVSSFMPRRDVDVPAALLADSLHPSLRSQLDSPALLQICKERGQETERQALLKVLDALDANVLGDYAMLFAQIELYKEDPKNVPVFEKAKLDSNDLVFARENHPVWSRMPVFHTQEFKDLIVKMREVFLKGDTLRDAAVQQQVNADNVNVLGRLGDLQAEVVETRRALARIEASMQEKIQAGVQAGVESALQNLANLGVTGVPATGGVAPLTVVPGAGAADVAPTTTPGNAVSMMTQPEPFFASAKLFAWPSDCFAAYHDSFHGIGPASRVLASKGYTRQNLSHTKFWSKIRHVVYNIVQRVKDETRWPDDASGNSSQDQRAVYGTRLELVLKEVDDEFRAWATGADGTRGTGRTLLTWCQSRPAEGFLKRDAQKGWHERLWPEADADADADADAEA